jgi:hypothetical protein
MCSFWEEKTTCRTCKELIICKFVNNPCDEGKVKAIGPRRVLKCSANKYEKAGPVYIESECKTCKGQNGRL